jgi:hypothetical protein
MLTAFTTLGLGIKVIGLTAIAAILLTASVSMAIQTSYAQFGVQQEQEPQGGGEQQVESDGGLTATLNGESFRRGDTIIIGGTVAEREGGSTVYARIYDPDSIEIDFKSIHVNTDGSFRQGFVAGEDSLNDGTSDPMTKSGTYTIALEYSPPGLTDTESTELTFEYDAEAPPTVGGQDDSATITAEGPTTTFQNLTEGFRIGVPTGWVEDDGDIPDSARQQFVQTNGFEFLGAICPQEQALPKIGGLFDCVGGAAEGVEIIGYPDLSTRPEFAQVINQNQNITLNDLIAFDMEKERNNLPNPEDASRMSIEDQTETMVNVVDPNTNQTVQTLPAREVAYGLPAAFGDEINVRYVLLTLADNGNTGYRVAGILQEPIQLDEGMPPVVRQAFDSFELLATNSSRIQQSTTTADAQQQSQQNNATDITNPLSSNSATGSNSNITAAQTTQ